MTDLCTWSDLPRDQCDHCTPGARPTPPRTGATVTAELYAQAARRLRIAHPVALQSAEVRAIEIPNAIAVPDQPMTTHEYVVLLTEPTAHDEPRTIQQTNTDGSHTFVTLRHRTSSPSLLEQLGSAIEPMHSDGDGMRVFASKTPARIDAIDALHRIESETDHWLRRLQLKRQDTDTLEVLVRRAAATAGEDIRADVRSWWIVARTVTGWDAPTFRPRNTCPLCGVKDGLRVRIDSLTAVCVECGEGWDAGSIQLLGNHIRMENDDVDDTQAPTGT